MPRVVRDREWCREWESDVEDAAEERWTFDYLLCFAPFRWYVESVSWTWVEAGYRDSFVYWDSLS